MDDAAGCSDLRDKYRELRALRDAYLASGEAAPRERLRALSQRFPGALRELDRLPSHVIDARLKALDAALRGIDPVPEWVPVQLAYHGWLRLAFALRSAPADLGVSQLAAQLEAVLASMPGAPDPRQFTPGLLAEARRPPGGRLNPWVYLRLAEQFRMTPSAVEALLFGERAGVPACDHG